MMNIIIQKNISMKEAEKPLIKIDQFFLLQIYFLHLTLKNEIFQCIGYIGYKYYNYNFYFFFLNWL
jgi:hypothetical protein